MQADTEDRVVELLTDAGYWDNDEAWRFYNDEPNNFDRAGNQQRNPEAALVEKLVNSVDANLLRRSAEAGIDPISPSAPSSPREAVAVFYEGAAVGSIGARQGSLAEWSDARRRDVSRDITLAITGNKPDEGWPSLSIADAGEGQAPDRAPDTILSLSRGIKKAIPFVQGRFNMGGTGALRFCGTHNLQLVVSKRLPLLAAKEGVSTDWGFTIVRRFDPGEETRVSTYRYLAPVSAANHPRHGDLLTVDRETLPIFPEGQAAYSREASWGTLIKLYEYKTRARTHLFRRGGLQERLDILLPSLVLPIRLHECRDYRGEERSFETTLTGLEVRLGDGDGRSTNLEFAPSAGDISIRGQDLTYTIYAFKPDAAKTYKRGEGVLFVLGGQTHAPESDRFFRRKDVGMSYLANSLLVILDCSRLAGRTIEDLFMNSRDRLADEILGREILAELADVIKKHHGLRDLREARRQADIQGKIADERPLQDVLDSLLRRSPALARLFLLGSRLSNPFATNTAPSTGPFRGKPHPSYFRFRDHSVDHDIERPAHLGQRFRLTFETDVENEYFRRSSEPGELSVEGSLNGTAVLLTSNMNLFDGLGHLNVTLPDGAAVGDILSLTVTVTDYTIVEEFINRARITVTATAPTSPGGGGERRHTKPPDPAGTDQIQPAGIELPRVEWVNRDDWERDDWSVPMNETSGMRATLAEAEDESTGLSKYDFFVNADNIYLQTELKATNLEPELLKARFKYGMTLVGLGALRASQESERASKDQDEDDKRSGEDLVALATDIVAPVLLPMIDGLGGLELEEGADEGPTQDDFADLLID